MIDSNASGFYDKLRGVHIRTTASYGADTEAVICVVENIFALGCFSPFGVVSSDSLLSLTRIPVGYVT